MRTGYADSPLHTGRAPRWLFERMSALAREITLAIVTDRGPDEMLRRVSDPFWFQAFGCVLGFDWHSSGLTTTTCGALKDGLRGLAAGTGIVVAGGKGKTSRRTPFEIEAACAQTGRDPAPLTRASRLSAKVDSAAVQDGFEVYQHTFLFTDSGWAVVQQGMNTSSATARRYHWWTTDRFDADPHAAISGRPQSGVLNLVAGEAETNRVTATALAREEPVTIAREITRMRNLEMPRHHWIRVADIDPTRIERVLLNAYEAQPATYTELLATPGVGAKGLRALSLVAEVTYGEPASIRDPVSFSFAHGGKDGTPFPVDRGTYDATIESLRTAVSDARVGKPDKVRALKRLARV